MQTCGMTGRSYDYGMMRLMIERCAAALLGALRLSPGDHIGLILPNIPEFAVLIHGAMRAGLVVTFANPLYTAGETNLQGTTEQLAITYVLDKYTRRH
jgi:4-coumarate--CoA ligase